MSVRASRSRIGVDVYDPEAARAWLQAAVRDEVRAHGQPTSRIVMLADGEQVWVELGKVRSEQPDADVGATFRRLASMPGVERRFVVLCVEGEGPDGPEAAALIVEEVADERGASYWLSLLPFQVDPVHGVGRPSGWTSSVVPSAASLPHGVAGWVDGDGPPAALDPPAQVEPDVRMTCGRWNHELRRPDGVEGLAELGARIILPILASGGLNGAVPMVRATEFGWELWLLGHEQPVPFDDVVRAVSRRDESDGLVIGGVALFGGVTPEVPAVRFLAEHTAGRMERWVVLNRPDGPSGRITFGTTYQRPLDPAAARWFGVTPSLDVEITATGAAEA